MGTILVYPTTLQHRSLVIIIILCKLGSCVILEILLAILAWRLIAELIAADIVKSVQGSTTRILIGCVILACSTILICSTILAASVLALNGRIILSLVIGLPYLLVPVAGTVIGIKLVCTGTLPGKAILCILRSHIILHLLLAILASRRLIAKLIAADIIECIEGGTGSILAGILIGCVILAGSAILICPAILAVPILALNGCIILSLIVGLSYIFILFT